MIASLENQLHDAKDVITLIKDQHNLLRQSIYLVKTGSPAAADKQNNLSELIQLLTAHSEAEELTIYAILKDIDDAQLLTYENMEEHAVAKILIDELEDLNFRLNWSVEIEAKGKVLAEIIEHHILDEENQFFKLAEKLLTKEELLIIGDEFEEKFLIAWQTRAGLSKHFANVAGELKNPR